MWREHHAGCWRVLTMEPRTYQRGDYIPVGKAIGQEAPAHCVLERVTEWDFSPPPCAGRGHAPRRAGAPITSLKKLAREDLHAICRRVMELDVLLPA